MDNLRYYNAGRAVPPEAKKPISAGRLKGMTDINPMWRIKRLTEMFGPCGIGWWYEIVNEQIVNDEITKQRAAFVDILLFYRDPDTGEASHGIPGTGGASFVANEKNGPYLSDECFKMALSDALSVAAKAIGVAADVYFERDKTKYTGTSEATEAPTSAPEVPKWTDRAPVPEEAPPPRCEVCGEIIGPWTKGGQVLMTADAFAEKSKRTYGRCLCKSCVKKAQADAAAG